MIFQNLNCFISNKLLIIQFSEASHHEAKQSNGQKITVNAEHSKSFATAKKVFSADASLAKPTNVNERSEVASSTKSTKETTTPSNLDELHKKILALYGPKTPPLNMKDEKPALPIASSTGTIGMEMFENKVGTVKPSFSFNLMDNSAKPAEQGN